MTKQLNREITVALVVIAVAAWYFWQSTMLPTRSADPLGPAAYPKMLAVAMILFAILHVVVSYFRRLRLAEEEDPLQGRARLMGNLRIVGVVVATAAYTLLMEPLGYVISSFLYLAAIPAIVGERSVRGIAVSSILLTVVLFALFVMLLHVLVPEGILAGMMGQ